MDHASYPAIQPRTGRRKPTEVDFHHCDGYKSACAIHRGGSGWQEDDFSAGVQALSKLSEGKTYLCRSPFTKVGQDIPGVSIEEFKGPHPSGLAGTHIHMLDAVDRNKVVWNIGYADVADIGELFRTGVIPVERVVSLAGPVVKNPRLIRTLVGACVDGG